MHEMPSKPIVLSSTRIAVRLVRFSRVASCVVGLIGAIGLLGWLFNIAAFKQIVPGLASMKANSAVCCILCALALASIHWHAGERRIVWAGRVCAALVAGVATLTLCEHLLGWNVGIDQLLFVDASAATFPGRMSIITALSFLLLSLALLLFLVEGVEWLTNLFCLSALMIDWIALIGYLYDARSLYQIFPFSAVALHTALALTLLGIGILFARPSYALAGLIAGDSAASLMVRRLLPAALVIPALLGWVRWQGQLAGLYDTEFGLVLLVVMLTIVFTAIVWWNARLLAKIDHERVVAAQALLASEELSRATFEQAAVGIARVGLEGQWLQVNQKLPDIVGYTHAELLNRTFQSITYPEDLDTDIDYMREMLRGERATYAAEQRSIRKDGTLVWVNLTVSLVREATGEPAYFISVVEDISDRKRAEAALRESQERLSAIVGSAMDAIISVDEAHKIVLFNHAAEQMFRCSASAVMGHSLDQFIPELLRGHHAEHTEHFGVANATSHSMRALGELTALRADGEEFPIEATISQVMVAGEKIVTVVIRDIAERKQDEAELRQSEQRFAIAFRFSPVAKAITRVADGTLVDVNDRYAQLLGYAREDLIGRTGLELNILVDPKDRAKLVRILSERGAVHEYETMVRAKSGQLHDVLVSIEVTEIDGEVCNLVILVDITERKQADLAIRRYAERLKRLREMDHAILAAGSIDGIARAALDHVVRMLPSIRASITLIDDDTQEIVPLAVFSAASSQLNNGSRRAMAELADIIEMLRSGKIFLIDDIASMSSTPEPLRTLAAEGVSTYMTAPMLVQGRLIGMLNIGAPLPNVFTQEHREIALELAGQLAIAIDQSNLRTEIQRHAAELEQRVAARTTELAAANKELEAFSYSVSHDLRAPLRAIAGFSRILVEDYAEQIPGEAQDYLLLVRDNAQQMDHLINDLLAFSRLSRQPLNKQLVAPADLVLRILAELRAQNTEHEVECVLGELPSCWADPALLRQVYVNLLTNAFKFTSKRRHPRIECGAQVRVAQANETVYFVKDNGAGFDMRYADKLFGVFQRLHRAEDYEGTGVGLAIVQRVISRHGGRIWAEGAVDQGATFYFTLGDNGNHG